MKFLKDVGRELGGKYIAPGAFATDYDLRTGQRLRERSKNMQVRQDARNTRAQDLLSGKTTGEILSGSEAEQQGQLAGLNLAATGYGQGLGQIGKDIQGVKSEYDALAKQGGADPVSSAIMAQKQGALASASRQLQSSGVRGPAAAAALASVGQKQDADIAASLYGQKFQTLGAQRGLASNMLAGTTALMQGEKAANVKMPQAPETSGFMGTVICTELYRQGYYSTDLLVKDIKYGEMIRATKPEVYIGYRLWADSVVKLMKKSKLFTKFVALFAVPWAKNMAGQSNLLGALISTIGEPICGIIGKLSMKLGAKYARKIN